MKKLIALFGMLFALAASVPAFAVVNPENVEGNAWYNVTLAPAMGTCDISDSVSVEGKNHVTIYMKTDTNLWASGGYIIADLSPNGVSWYEMQGLGWLYTTPSSNPAFAPLNGAFNWIFSAPEGTIVAKFIRFRSCFNETNLTVSVFTR